MLQLLILGSILGSIQEAPPFSVINYFRREEMSAAIARCIRSSSATSPNRHYTPGMYLEDHPSVATDLLSTDNEDVDDDFIIEQTSTPGSSVVDTTPSSVTNSFTPTSFYTTPVGDLTSRARLLDENINLTPLGPPMNKTSRRPDVGSIMQQQQALLEKILRNGREKLKANWLI